MMITEITIRGFKSLENIEHLELGLVNVFVGANGSGKSNILEALGVLGAAASGRVDDKALSRRGVRPGVPRLYKTSLKGKKELQSTTISFKASGTWQQDEAEYGVSLDSPKGGSFPWDYHSEKLQQNDNPLFNRSLGKPTQLNIGAGVVPSLKDDAGLAAIVRGYQELAGAPGELLKLLDEYVIFAPTTPVLRGIEPDSEQKDPVGLWGGRLAEAVKDILDLKQEKLGGLDLDEVYDLLGWVSNFDVTASSRQLLPASVPSLLQVIRFEDRWMKEGQNQLSGYDASEGTLYVLFMLVLALHPKAPHLFGVDSFDQAMHPRLARAMTRLFCQQILAAKPSRQVLLTTHNPLVLDGLDLRDDRIRLFAVERDSNTRGATRIHRVQVSADILEADQKGLSLSNLWVLGRLGGVPDLF